MQLNQSQAPGKWNKAKGFSLFELVVFIIVVAIIYASAARRVSDFPGEAERANFITVLNQLQTAVNLEMMLSMGQNQNGGLAQMIALNPMDMLLQAPSNYRGAFENGNNFGNERRSWYYDLDRRELVYLVNDSEDVYLLLNGSRVPTEELRFSLQATYRQNSGRQNAPSFAAAESEDSDERGGGSINGMLLAPVVPYEWGSNLAELMDSDLIEG